MRAKLKNPSSSKSKRGQWGPSIAHNGSSPAHFPPWPLAPRSAKRERWQSGNCIGNKEGKMLNGERDGGVIPAATRAAEAQPWWRTRCATPPPARIISASPSSLFLWRSWRAAYIESNCHKIQRWDSLLAVVAFGVYLVGEAAYNRLRGSTAQRASSGKSESTEPLSPARESSPAPPFFISPSCSWMKWRACQDVLMVVLGT